MENLLLRLPRQRVDENFAQGVNSEVIPLEMWVRPACAEGTLIEQGGFAKGTIEYYLLLRHLSLCPISCA